MEKKKVLIIGGCGYIGSTLSLYLRAFRSKYEADVVDNMLFGNPGDIDAYRIRCEDLDPIELSLYDVVILLSGFPSVQMCAKYPDQVFDRNVTAFINLMNKLDDKTKFIYASSSSVYGSCGLNQATEEDVLFKPDNHYDVSKHIIDLYAQLSNKNYYGLRFGTVCGFSRNLRGDVMINSMVISAQKNQVVKIGQQHVNRPILGMSDLCRVIQTIIDGPNKPGIYNIGSFNSTVGEVGRRVAAAMDVPTEELKFDSPAYDFSISTEKFENAYDFKFNDTVESIVRNIVSGENATITYRS